MRNVLWESFDIVKEMVSDGEFDKVAEIVGKALNASMETIADVLPSANAPVLREGLEAANGALAVLRSKVKLDRRSADYTAGRLAAAMDILAYAASATADEASVKKAKRQPYVQIIELLAEQPLRNTDIVDRIRKDKAYVSRLLDELRGMDIVTSHRHGRDLFNALTPVGRLIVEEGIEDARRAPIGESRVFDLGVYSLAQRPTPADVKQSQLPRLSAA
ncbi:winged helix-turn-helix transcriptional regulator [Rhizobium laguerreae]|uniref:winged helix-turn-helix domain-containing protein n=1 Tax=Rhizobium laguerreae TaxID=1076926 RepID=UPI001C8FD3A6|nr:winged helix-turn-helix domain-containing protein [Rhizobium laguerreae]MBY3081094.1 winged helix-turn-helix transcriptional regulator [Rhizobium laguerreae]